MYYKSLIDIFLNFVSISGFIGSYGYENLSKNQTATMSHLMMCYYDCGPNTAIDDDRGTCTRGEAVGGSSSSTATWWTVDLGGNCSIYSVNILFKEYMKEYEMRQRGRFAGFSLYISNTLQKEDGHLCYKNTLPLPPLQFNTTCIGYGRYVIYYNERLKGVMYPEGYQNLIFTELCDFQVKGCAKSGVYGRSCDLNCPTNCLEHRCDIINGTCLGCMPGWMGNMCRRECPWGLYGFACKNLCAGYCKENQACNHVTGHCDEGCAAGWIGKNCDKQCKGGTYGLGCIHNCTGHCQNDTFCNRDTGHCDKGCSPGYLGDFCNRSCSNGVFGNNCNERCSEFCQNGVCDHTNGTCVDGCLDGYIGTKCNIACPTGSFGNKCKNSCSKNCIVKCRHVDGQCDCLPGFKDSPDCTTECANGSYGVNCQYKCSGHCLNREICSKFDGSCPGGCQDQYRGLACDYQDGTPIGLSISVAVNIIFVLSIAVFIILRRQEAYNFLQGKIRHHFQRSGNHTDVAPVDVNAKIEKPFYEELDTLQSKNEYEELKAQKKTAYENLALTTA